VRALAEVKWIKLQTDIFDDEKILLIESLPDAYAIITVWFKLLCMAGKQNNDGVFMMSNRLAYTEKMLATIFRMNEATVTLALKTFEQFGMIEIVEGVITIPNWGKHQSLDSYEKKKQRDRLYQSERRAAQKEKILQSTEKSSDNRLTSRLTSGDCKTTQSSDVAFSDKDIDKEEDEERDKEKYKKESASPKTYGEYKNVFLSDDEYINLSKELPNTYLEWIEYLSEYMASSGKKYKSHFVTIKSWAKRKDKKEKEANQIKPTRFNNFSGRSARELTARERMHLQKQMAILKPTAGTDEALQKRADELKEKLCQ
jgi:predicted phage replisome organizer